MINTHLHGVEVTQDTVPEGYMLDSKGRLVPIETIDDWHLEQDAMVKNLHQLALAQQHALREFKRFAYAECYAFLDLLAEKYGRNRGGAKGNVSFTSYDGQLQVKICIKSNIQFGPELQIAKGIIDECFHRWSEGADPNLRAVINDAFEVDKEGNLNTGRILSLRRLKIDDEQWLRAMTAIADAILVTGSKSYINFLARNDEGKLVNVSLDLASL
ncbi:DUF3164 family protein [Shewanella xiamenensis]|uniref:DUF3164 family protein n=1 Tax=Shewanella xiamenensis TaxID=332186 RepID=UPI000849D15C|nr:DUF3164 family protein [Shewanella xiamenensis]ODR86722.1 sulfate transporter [Shewanella xiamenensis]